MTGKRPFTLMELLIVIGIIAILAAFLFPAASKLTTKSKIKAATAEMTRVRAALDEYYEDYGRYPHENVPDYRQTWGIANAALDTRYDCALRVRDNQWLDPWGTEMHYILRNTKVMLLSYGPDKTYGTDDDIEAR